MKRSCIALMSGILLLSTNSFSGELPDGWYQFDKGSDSIIETGIDTNTYHSSPSSFYLKCTSGTGGNINQKINGSEYAGKRIKLSGYIKTDNLVNGGGYGAQIWAYSYTGKNQYMTSAAGNVTGTTDWTEYTVVFDVPEEEPSVTYGLSVHGQGTVWIDSIKWEVVDKGATPLKNAKLSALSKPNNLP